jgi:fermentation-respiration switch protein FrsA (DUF1100 family)
VSFLRRHFTYRPWREIPATPDEVGLAFEDVEIVAADGVRLHGWWMPREAAARSILWLHGNAGNVGHRVREAKQLHRLGASLLLPDYRGYGRSEGTPSEAGLLRDADAALAWLGARGVPRGEIVLYGRSLGGAVAIDLAARTEGLAGLVVVSTFTSLRDMAPRVLPVPGVRRLAGREYEAERTIGRVTCPILIVHGDDDELVPLSMGARLAAAATSPTTVRIVRGGGHESTHLEHEDLPGFADSLRAFLGGSPRTAPPR